MIDANRDVSSYISIFVPDHINSFVIYLSATSNSCRDKAMSSLVPGHRQKVDIPSKTANDVADCFDHSASQTIRSF